MLLAYRKHIIENHHKTVREQLPCVRSEELLRTLCIPRTLGQNTQISSANIKWFNKLHQYTRIKCCLVQEINHLNIHQASMDSMLPLV